MDTRVRYSEVDENKVLRPHELINYFQNCSIFHSEDVGLGFPYLEKKHRHWVLCYWQLHINRMPVFGERVTVRTNPYDFKGIIGRRNFFLYSEQNELLAYADSIWSYVDENTLLPTKITPEDIDKYECEPPIEMENFGRKISLPKELEEKEPFKVLSTQLDSNHHVNNGQYIAMALPYVDSPEKIKVLRIEYKKSAVLGDTIYPLIAKQDGITTVLLANEQKVPYAIIETRL